MFRPVLKLTNKFLKLTYHMCIKAYDCFVIPPNNLVTRITAYITLCAWSIDIGINFVSRYLQNPRQIEACVDAAMESCTKNSIRSAYHTAVVKLAGFCEQAKGETILHYFLPNAEM